MININICEISIITFCQKKKEKKAVQQQYFVVKIIIRDIIVDQFPITVLPFI